MKHEKCLNCGSVYKSVFCDFNDPALSELDSKKVCNQYKKGQSLFVQDTPVYGVFCISSGKVKLVKNAENGKESILRIAKGGDMIGHRSLFSHQDYQASATALEDTDVCFIDKKYFEEAIKKEPSLSLRLLEKISENLGDSEKRLSAVSQNTVEERVAGFLCYLNRAFGVDEEGKRLLNIKLTREEMASMVGTASETLIRTLSDLKKQGHIHLDGKNIYIVNIEALLDLAGISH